MKYLEDFRNDNLNKTAFLLNTKPPLLVFLNYNVFSIQAYRFTMECLAQLENSTTILNNGISSIPAICMWYLSMESYLNSILKVSCLRTNREYLQASILPLTRRFKLILEDLKIDFHEIPNNDLIEKLEDFEKYQKYISQDLFESEKLTFKKASFSGRPNFVNQVDVLQAFLISYELFESLRAVINGLDLMPNIALSTDDNHIVYEKLNVLKLKVIIPSIEDILIKHKLKITIDLNQRFKSYSTSELFQKGQVLAINRYIQEEPYKINLSLTKTQILSDFHTDLMKKFVGNENKCNMNFTANI